MKIMAVDYGDRHTGIAVSDMTGSITGRAWTVDEWSFERLADKVAEIAEAEQAETIVLGCPKNMDGTYGPRAEKSRQFAELLRQRMPERETVLWDERRTTVDAHRILQSGGKNAKKRKKTVDAVAASLILEGYLAFINKNN